MKFIAAAIVAIWILTLNVSSQSIPDNAVDFKLKDVDGVEHHLFSYLENNKYILIKFTATW